MQASALSQRFLQGSTFHLEKLSVDHISDKYLSWLNDPVVCKENSHAIFPLSESDLTKYIESTSPNSIHFAIIDHRYDHIGNSSISDINWVNRSCDINILIGNRASWGKGIGYEVCKILRDYAFTRLNLRRVKMGMTASNKAMNRIAKNLGMKQEGVFKDALFKDGQYVDIVQYATIRSDE